jgi:NAD(P)-dependent dehydrogenase (short-subunit alcohol dehydrogenase family)
MDPHRRETPATVRFDGQVAIVTGAGRGLGRLYALEFARRGASVVVNDLGGSMQGVGEDHAVAHNVVKEIVEAGGVAVASTHSVASPEGGAGIVETALDHFGRVDAVVSNAGIFNTLPFDALSPEEWRRMLRVHLDGAFYLSQPAFKLMKAQGYGRIVFIASSAGLFGQPESAHYAAAKAGIVGLTNVVAVEGAPFGILANSVLPFGYSRMVTETVGDRDQFPSESSFLHAIEPELVVPIVVYLASRACDVTHHNYSACAGRFGRVFVGLAKGWLAENGATPTPDDVCAHFGEISTVEPFIVPESIFDEVAEVCLRLGISG